MFQMPQALVNRSRRTNWRGCPVSNAAS